MASHPIHVTPVVGGVTSGVVCGHHQAPGSRDVQGDQTSGGGVVRGLAYTQYALHDRFLSPSIKK